MLLAVYTLLILLASLAGGLLPAVVRLDHARMQLALSTVAGVMFGVGVIHMIPHAVVMWQSSGVADVNDAHAGLDALMLAVMLGFLVMFLLERFLSFHHHESPEEILASGDGGAAGHGGKRPHGRGHSCAHEVAESLNRPGAGPVGWVGALAGLAVHTVLNGLALAAAVQAACEHDHGLALAGFGVFLGVALHKPFDAMTITMLMRAAGVRRSRILLANGGFALMILAGVGLFFLGVEGSPNEAAWTGLALAFSAGTFLCIALSDLLPELQFHSHDRLKLTAALLLGIGIAWGTGVLEKGVHAHAHGSEAGHVHGPDCDHDH